MNTINPPQSLPTYAVFWVGLVVYLTVLHVENVIALRNLAFFSMLVATLTLLVRIKRRPEFPFFLPWALYATVAVVSITYSVDPLYSARNIQAEIGYGALVLIVSATWSRWSPSFGNLLVSLVSVNILLEVASYSVASFNDTIAQIENLPPLASAGLNSNFLVSVLPFLVLAVWWSWSNKRGLYACLPAILIVADLGALVMSYNRQSFIAVLASGVCAGGLLLRNRRSLRHLTLFFIFIALIVSLLCVQLARRMEAVEVVEQAETSTISGDVRWDLWKFSFDKIKKSPLSGSGFGRETFGKFYPEFLLKYPSLWHAHNMVINKGVQMGIPGLVAFLLLWFAIVRELARHLWTSAIRHAVAVTALSVTVAVFVKNMTDDHFLRDPAFLFWLLIGMSVGNLRRLEGEEKAVSVAPQNQPASWNMVTQP